MRVLVVTVVHHPGDARIAEREIPALLEAGHEVTYAAAFHAYGVEPPAGVRALEVPRSVGRRRVGAVRAARELIAAEAPAHDVVLVHDPELLLALPRSSNAVLVWDVHEDTPAAVSLKPWLPRALRPATAAAVGRVESAASQRVRLLLAEDAYRERFGYHHPVVPNSTPSPETVLPSGDDRVVYVGSLSQARGVPELCELGEMLRPDGVTVHLVGGADVWSREQLERAHADGDVVWHGFVPNAEAMRQVDGALAGLSLLHDEPNYAHSMPTKVIEYMAHGVPVVTTPTQRARELVERAGCGVVVPFAGTAEEAAEAVRALRSDPGRRQAMADSGRAVALADYDWRVDGPRFVAVLEDWVRLKPQR